jgi:hypothetical protein
MVEDRSPVLLGTGIAFVALAWITFCLRVYVRGFLLRSWGTDDWLIACSLVSPTCSGESKKKLTSLFRVSSPHTSSAKQAALFMAPASTCTICNQIEPRPPSYSGGCASCSTFQQPCSSSCPSASSSTASPSIDGTSGSFAS